MKKEILADKSLVFRCKLFDVIPSQERDAFLDDLKFSYKAYDKGDLILRQGTEYNALLILLKGEVLTEMSDEKGEFLPIESIKAVNALAQGFLFAPQNFSPVTVVAKTDCVLISISKENVFFLMRKYEAFMRAFLRGISEKIMLLSEKIRISALRTIKAKLAYYILQEAGEKKSFTLKMSKERLSRVFGVSRPALVNVMKQLSDAGIIAVEKREITILSRADLQKLL